MSSENGAIILIQQGWFPEELDKVININVITFQEKFDGLEKKH